MTEERKELPEFERREGETDLEAWQRWFRESGNADFWASVPCIECELGRRCLKNPPCKGAEANDD